MKPLQVDDLYTALCVVALLLCLTLPGRAGAQEAPSTPSTPTTTPAIASGAFERPLNAEALDAYRGGTEIVNNDMRLAGTTAGNTAINVDTGSNAITAGAFANMSGLPVVIQNTGANVLIQNATILNLQLN